MDEPVAVSGKLLWWVLGALLVVVMFVLGQQADSLGKRLETIELTQRRLRDDVELEKREVLRIAMERAERLRGIEVRLDGAEKMIMSVRDDLTKYLWAKRVDRYPEVR